MAIPTITPQGFRHRLLILVVILALVIVGLTAILIWWPRQTDRLVAGQTETSTEAARETLPEALQPAEDSVIDNSDILAQAPEVMSPETAPADQAQPVKLLTLMVRNHNRAADPVDIRVTLDGRIIVDESFKYGSTIKLGEGTEVPAPGLDWKQLPLKLAMGRHQIKAESTTGEATFATDFTTTDKDWWASLEYVDGQKFDWQLSELPIIPL